MQDDRHDLPIVLTDCQQGQLPNYCYQIVWVGYPRNANAEGVEKLHRWTMDSVHDLLQPAVMQFPLCAVLAHAPFRAPVQLLHDSHYVRMRPAFRPPKG